MRLPRLSMAAVGIVIALLSDACGRTQTPRDVALDYGRALYANDVARVYALVSTLDRMAKDEASVAAQMQPPHGFALDLLRDLARFVTASPVDVRVVGDHATVTLTLRLPNANDPVIRALARDWDEERLQGLTAGERRDVRRRVEDLGRRRQLPMIEGVEKLALVKEAAGWRLVVHWAGAIPVRVAAVALDRVPLQVAVMPERVSVKPGEAFRVTVRARNASNHEITSRVGHRITPGADAKFLALLQCPLFLPATLKPGESKEFVSEYLLLEDAPPTAKAFDVLYTFAASVPEIPVR